MHRAVFMNTPWLVPVALGFVLVVSARPAGQDRVPMDLEREAQRIYLGALNSLQTGARAQAEQELAKLAGEIYRATSVYGPALLRLAESHFETRNLVQARTRLTELTGNPLIDRSSKAMGYVLLGRVTLASGRDPQTIAAAVSEFQRVAVAYPWNAAVAAAKFYEAEARRLSRDFATALEVYREVSSGYPRSRWAALALLAEARCLVKLGRGELAFAPLQRVREGFPDTEEALTALRWNTILYRLYLRQSPPLQFANRSVGLGAGKLKDVISLGFDSAGTLYAVLPTGLTGFDPDTGATKPGVVSTEIRSLTVNPDGNTVIVRKGGVQTIGGPFQPLVARRQKEVTPRPLENVSAVVFTTLGDLVVADRDRGALLRFRTGSDDVGIVSQVKAQRLVVDDSDLLAALDDQNVTVELFTADGKGSGRLTKRDDNWNKVVDICFDALGHLYLLDRGSGSLRIYVVSDRPRLKGTLTIPQKAAGAFRRAKALAVGPAGQVFIYDEGTGRIQVYQ